MGCILSVGEGKKHNKHRGKAGAPRGGGRGSVTFHGERGIFGLEGKGRQETRKCAN